MKFAKLAEYFERIEGTSSRNEMMEILADLLHEAESREVAEIVYLALGRLRPKFDNLEFNLAEKMVVRAVAGVAGRPVEELTKEFKERGDLGLVVEKYLGEVEREEEVGQVYAELVKIAKEGGQGSQERKINRVVKMLQGMSAREGKYLVRVVLAKLRLGFSDKTVLDALSYMEYGSKKGRNELDAAYQVFPDAGKIAEEVKKAGIGGLSERVEVALGTPVLSALAQRLKTADEMIEKMGEVVAEPKFDGTRVQIHFSRVKEEKEDKSEQGGLFVSEEKTDWVRSYTRNLDENSAMFPELRNIGEEIAAEEVILDSEAVGYDPTTGKMLPFQMTITRKRKHGVGEASKEVPLRFYVFDVLYKDGESLLEMPLVERRKILQKVVISKEGGVLVLDEYLVTGDPREVRKFHAQQLEKGLEGAMVKKAEGKYLPGRQDWNWVKFKEAEGSAGKLSDTLDLVVMGYYAGRGKRQQFGIGAFLVGVRDPSAGSGKAEDEIRTIAKIGTGLTDKEWGEMYDRLEKVKSEKMDTRYMVDKTLVPDVWVEPEVVVEIAADEVTKSPAHTSGYALRFPRLVKFREDKDLSGVTTIEEVKQIAGIG